MIKAKPAESISSELKYERRFDLDWLPLLAIIILLFYHTGMLFVPWGWHIKNNDLSQSFGYWMVWLHAWRMPLLLFISGAGTYMALGKRTPARYVRERFSRLFVPLIFGMFVIVPPQIFYEHISEYESYADFYKTVFNFVPYPKGSFSWHHLWFVAYLFFFSLIALPYLVFLRSERSVKFRKANSKMLSKPAGILLIPSLVIFFSQLILRPYFPEETHSLLNDWAYFVYYFLFFLFGMTCYASLELWNSIGKNRKQLLKCTVFILIPYYVLYFHFRGIVVLPFEMETVDIMFEIMETFVSWFCVITVIAWGQHYLNKPHPLLKHVNEGLYPFYILHQTVIIVIGYYICKNDWSIFLKFWAVSLGTLATCMIVYFALIRPFNLMRLFFGMKWLKKADG
jgi:glucan biosynthesis protein C